MIAYFDTSAFVKLLVQENGSATVARLWDSADRAVASTLMYPEARAALAVAVREGRASGEDEGRALIDRLIDEVALVPATRPVLWRAGDLASRHGLRGYDAVHLASAVPLAVPGTIMVTADRRLASAARAEGLAVAPALVK